MLVVVAVLAIASGARYYFVMTLGERVVADLRSDLFAHLTRLDPGFFDAEKTGEIASRLSADTTQLKATFGSSASIALRNLFMFVGAIAMMVVTSAKLSAFVLAAIPIIVLPLFAAGPGGAPAFAPRPGYARRRDRLRHREPVGGARDAVLHRRSLHRQALPGRRLRRLRGGAQHVAGARDRHRGGAVPGLRQRRRRAVARRAGRRRRPHLRRHR